jgi:hypothetical protein
MYLAQTSNPSKSQSKETSEPPPLHHIKLDFDGASKGNPRPSGVEGPFRDPTRNIREMFSLSLGSNTNNGDKLACMEKYL